MGLGKAARQYTTANIPHQLGKKRTAIFIKFVVALTVLAAACIIGVAVGSEHIPFTQIKNVLFSSENTDTFAAVIIRDLRLPRVLLAGICGALLAGAGAVFQGFFRNPLAEPGIMGISSGAALGAALSSVFATVLSSILITTLGGDSGTAASTINGATTNTVAARIIPFIRANITMICAFFTAGGTAVLIYTASKFTARTGGTAAILLTGTAAGTFFSAVTSVILLVKDKELHKMFVWTLGSFNGKGWDELVFILPAVVISITLLTICSRFLDILGGGMQTAQALGLNPAYARLSVLGAGSLAAAAAVCAGGTIGFVGLIAPHIARRLFSPHHRVLIPASMLTGAIFLIFCDTVARTAAAPAEIPVGIITALTGAPFFISLLFYSHIQVGGIGE